MGVIVVPSFIVHSVAGREISKYLKLKGDDKTKFFIANLLPDCNQVEIDNKWDDIELRRQIQRGKRVTHFRTEVDSTIEAPDMDYFLKKYKNNIKMDIVAFGYFFHLYTDYYYFTKFLPKMITFLDKDYNVTTSKKDNVYIKVSKTGKILGLMEFWGKHSDEGLYGDYNRLNKYIIDKYNFKYNFYKYKKFLDSGEFHVIIKEINPSTIYTLLRELNNFYKVSFGSPVEEFKIFKEEDVDKFIEDVIDSFLTTYSEYL